MKPPDRSTLSLFGAILCCVCLIGGLFLIGGLAVGAARAVKNEIAGIFGGYVILGAGLTALWWLCGLACELGYTLRRLWYKLVSKDPLDPPPEPSSRDQELLKRMFGYVFACGVLGAAFVGILQIVAALGTAWGIKGSWAATLFIGACLILAVATARRGRR